MSIRASVCEKRRKKTAILFGKEKRKYRDGTDDKKKNNQKNGRERKSDRYIDAFGRIEYSVCFVLLSHVEMNPAYTEGPTESIPLRSNARQTAYLPVAAAGQTFGTPYFLMCVHFSLDMIETERKTGDETIFLVRR